MQTGAFVLETAFVLGVVTGTEPKPQVSEAAYRTVPGAVPGTVPLSEAVTGGHYLASASAPCLPGSFLQV